MTKTLMKITLERKIFKNDIDKENNIIDKNANDIWFLKEKKDNIDKKSIQIILERKILENDIGKENNIIDKNVNDIWFLKEKKDIIDKNSNENYFGEKDSWKLYWQRKQHYWQKC